MSDASERLLTAISTAILRAWEHDGGHPEHDSVPEFVARAICEELGIDGEEICYGPGDFDAGRNPKITPGYEAHVANALATLLEAGGR